MKCLSGKILNVIYKSPLLPCFPILPLPDTLSLLPSSIPFGTLIVILSLTSWYPLPLQSGHLVVGALPLPWHFGQVCEKVIKPCLVNTCPCPSHCGHVESLPSFAPVPLQLLQAVLYWYFISFSQPKTASLKLMVNS